MIDFQSWNSLSPEIVLLCATCVIALVDLWVTSAGRTLTYVLSLLTLVVVSAMEGSLALTEQVSFGFSHMVVFDPLGHWLKCFSALAVLITFVYGRPYAQDRDMLRGG